MLSSKNVSGIEEVKYEAASVLARIHLDQVYMRYGEVQALYMYIHRCTVYTYIYMYIYTCTYACICTCTCNGFYVCYYMIILILSNLILHDDFTSIVANDDISLLESFFKIYFDYFFFH